MTTPPPPFDPELAAVLADLGDQAPTTATPDDIPAARERLRAEVPLPTNDELSCGGLFEVRERTVPGPPGAPDVSLLICRPTSVPGPRPIVYFTHPGGMIVGTNRLGLPLDWAEELGLVVVSVEYRLAPEHPHPAPVEDCYAGLVWTGAH
ncbi:esterase, partial [Streptomyces scabiei]